MRLFATRRDKRAAAETRRVLTCLLSPAALFGRLHDRASNRCSPVSMAPGPRSSRRRCARFGFHARVQQQDERLARWRRRERRERVELGRFLVGIGQRLELERRAVWRNRAAARGRAGLPAAAAPRNGCSARSSSTRPACRSAVARRATSARISAVSLRRCRQPASPTRRCALRWRPRSAACRSRTVRRARFAAPSPTSPPPRRVLPARTSQARETSACPPRPRTRRPRKRVRRAPSA